MMDIDLLILPSFHVHIIIIEIEILYIFFIFCMSLYFLDIMYSF